jgi:hypothetical protein
MHGHDRRRVRSAVLALVGLTAVAALAAPPAAADPIGSGSARGFGAEVTLGGEPAILEPEAVVETAPGDVEETTIDIPAEPLLVSGTLIAKANVHTEADIATGLTVNQHEGATGPFNARGLGQIEGLEVLLDAAGEGVSLLSAAVIRGEAVAVCTGGSVQYAATSEIVDLRIGGEEIPLNSPLQDLIDGISTVLEESGLNAAVSVSRNVVTQLEGGGVAVDALVVSLAEGALATITFGHGEVGPVACAPAVAPDVLPETGAGQLGALVGAAFLAAAVGTRALRRRATA